jgi:CelD/BcsL family acetyltransferase involved in cellulose biosynthesis
LLKLTEINDQDQFAELEYHWNTTLDKSEGANIFLTWEWLSSWWRHYGKQRELIILLAKDGQKIVGIAPLVCSTQSVFGLKVKKIELMGVEHTDYRNFILTEKKDQCLKLFLTHLNKLRWDFLELKHIPEVDEPLVNLRRFLGENILESERVAAVCPYIALTGNFDDYLQIMPGRMRRELTRVSKNLSKNYKVAFQRFDTVESLNEGIDSLVTLHQKRWHSKGGRGSFEGDPEFKPFILDACKQLTKKGLVNLTLLKADDTAVAAALCFEYKNIRSFYHQGYDPEFSKFAVGNLMIMHIIQGAVQMGYRTFDFLQGDESYKSRWASQSKNTLKYSCIQNHLLPTIIEKVTKANDNLSKSDWNFGLSKLKRAGRGLLPSGLNGLLDS